MIAEKTSGTTRSIHAPPLSPNRLLLLLFVLTISLGSIWGKTFDLHDESRVAGIVWEMVLGNDYILPRLNGTPFLEYPSLGYIPTALLYRLTGEKTPFIFHLSIILVGMGTTFFTFLMGKRLGGEPVGLAAAFFLQATAGFINLNSQLMVDASLAFWIVLSLYGFFAGYSSGKYRFAYFIIFYLAMAGGVLTKGIIGAGLPAVIVAVFILVKKDFSLILKLRPWWGLPIFALPIAVWTFFLYRSGHPDLVYEVLRQSLYRFFSSSADHAYSPTYYLLSIPYLFFPWIIFLPFILWRNFKPRFEKARISNSPETLLPIIWFLTVFTVLMIASAKRNIYLGPIYPALALMAALWWKQTKSMDNLPRIEAVLIKLFPYLSGVCLIAGIVLAFVKTRYILGSCLTGGAFCLVAGLIAFREKSSYSRNLIVFFFTSYTLAVLTFNQVITCPDVYQSSLEPFFNGFKPEWEEKRILLYAPNEAMRGAAYYHFGRELPMAANINELKGEITKSPPSLFIAWDIDLKLLNEALRPHELTVLSQRSVRTHHIMLLSEFVR